MLFLSLADGKKIVTGRKWLESFGLAEVQSFAGAHWIHLNIKIVFSGQRKHSPLGVSATGYYYIVRDIKKIRVSKPVEVVEVFFAGASRDEFVNLFETCVVFGNKTHSICGLFFTYC